MTHYEPNNDRTNDEQQSDSPGVRFADTAPLPGTEVATVSADQSRQALWDEVAHTDAFTQCLVECVGTVVGDASSIAMRTERLDDAGVEPQFATACAWLGDHRTRRFWAALETLYEYGSTEPSRDPPRRPSDRFNDGKVLADIEDGPMTVFRAAGRTPTLVVELDARFEDLRADQRRELCSFLTTLGTGLNVTIVASGYWQRKLVAEYNDELPAAVSETITGSRMGAPSERERTATVDAAIDRFDADGSAMAILREIAGNATGTAPYDRLYATIPLSNEGVRNRLAALAEADLVQRDADSSGNGYAELLTAGSDVLDRLDATVGQQSKLEKLAQQKSPDDAAVSDPPSSFEHIRVCPEQDGGDRPEAEDESAGRSSDGGGWIDVEYLPRYVHTAATAAVDGCDVGVVDHPPDETGTTPLFSYDDEADRVVCGAQYTSPLGYAVCAARAFAGAKMWDQVLPPKRLDADGVDLGALIGGNLEGWTRIRQGGWCSSDERTGADYIERLQTVLSSICRSTTDYHVLRNDDRHEEANELAGNIIQRCHGLVGTVVAILDECDVDTTRYLSFDEYTRNWHTTNGGDRRRSVLKTMAKMSTIGSFCGGYPAERVMFESRADKRAFSLGAPDTTAGDSIGELAGSWCIVGDAVSRFVDPDDGDGLAAMFENPGEYQPDMENYAEFETPISIRSDRSREAARSAAEHALAQKNLRPTPAAISAFAGLVGSTFDATEAITRALDGEDRQRRIRLDEVRRVLAHVPDERLLTDVPERKVGHVLGSLLRADEPLSTATLASESGVSLETLRSYVSQLEALAAVERIALGPGGGYEWRCTLPTREERSDNPDDEHSPWADTTTTVRGKSFDHILHDLATTLYSDDCSTGCRDRPPSLADHAGVIRNEPALCREVSGLAAWIPTIAALTDTTLLDEPFARRVTPISTTATLGTAPDTVQTEVA